MKTRLTINKEIDGLFHQKCKELDIKATCMVEGENENRYWVEHSYYHDLFYLGMSIGLSKAQEIYNL